MQNVELKELQLLSKWKSYLTKAGYISAAEVLLTPPAILSKRTKLPPADIAELLLDLSIAVSGTPLAATRTVSEIAGPVQRECAEDTEDEGWVRQRRTISLGDEGLDALLGDGVHLGSVTEVAGQSASGKSHLCLQLSMQAQLPPALGGVSGGTILISSEGTFPSSRLLGLARCLTDTLPPSIDPPLTPWDLMDNVHAQKAQELETLDSLLAFLVPAQIERLGAQALAGEVPSSPPPEEGIVIPGGRTGPKRPPLPIKLVIVDSIAAPFRAEHETNFVARAKDLGTVGDQLKRLAYVYDCAVLVVNQVSDVFDNRRPSPRPPPAPTAPPPVPSRTGSPHPLNGNSHNGYNLSSTPYSSSPIPPRNKPAHEQYHLPPLLYGRYQVPHFSGQSPSFRAQAALGHSWANIVSSRIMLSRTKRRRVPPAHAAGVDPDQEEGETMLVRRMTMVFSPLAPRQSVEYVIEEPGLRSLGMPLLREPRWAGGEPTEEDWWDGVGTPPPEAYAEVAPSAVN